MKFKIGIFCWLMMFTVMNGLNAEALIKAEYKKKNADYSAYTELYIQNIDLRGMTFEIYDDDKRAFEEERMDGEKLNDIAMELYDHFYLNVKDIIPINENQEIDPTKKALILNIKLSGRFRSEDRGVINWFITKSKSEKTNLTIECQLIDAQTKEELAVIKDEHVLISPDHEAPLSQPEEMDLITDIFRVWSTRFARALEQMRSAEPVLK